MLGLLQLHSLTVFMSPALNSADHPAAMGFDIDHTDASKPIVRVQSITSNSTGDSQVRSDRHIEPTHCNSPHEDMRRNFLRNLVL